MYVLLQSNGLYIKIVAQSENFKEIQKELASSINYFAHFTSAVLNEIYKKTGIKKLSIGELAIKLMNECGTVMKHFSYIEENGVFEVYKDEVNIQDRRNVNSGPIMWRIFEIEGSNVLQKLHYSKR